MSTTNTEDRRWKAVLERDRSRDADFVFAVVTTKIYCRPSCPARRPRRENVRFFPTRAEARRAGYRACRRCHPDSANPNGVDGNVERVLEYLEAHLEEKVTLEELSAALGTSAFHLQRVFRAHTGMSPKELLTRRRLDRFRREARNGKDLAQATYAAGFGSSRALYENAKSGLGMTPGQYARGADGVDIDYSIESCELGRVLIAFTSAGICAVLLGESERELCDSLAREFPRARRAPSSSKRREWIQGALRHLEDTRVPLGVPLDLRGTAFQIRVWRSLRAIPPGERRSYAQVAESVGAPRSARAVATACAHNTIAVLVPCHRVIRGDGSLGGYRWGIERKKALLGREES